MDTNEIESFAGIIASVAVAISAFLVYLQLRRLRLSQEVSIALTLFDRSNSPEMLEAASWIKSQMPDDFTYRQYQEDRAARQNLERLWYYFEFLGVLVNRKYISDDIIFDQQGAFIAGIWDKSKNIIITRRNDRKSPQYMENFQLLSERYNDWALKNRPKLRPSAFRRVTDYYRGEYKASPSSKLN